MSAHGFDSTAPFGGLPTSALGTVNTMLPSGPGLNCPVMRVLFAAASAWFWSSTPAVYWIVDESAVPAACTMYWTGFPEASVP